MIGETEYQRELRLLRQARRREREREARKYDPPSNRGLKAESVRPCRIHGARPMRYVNGGGCVACRHYSSKKQRNARLA
jgi:hypothetical protein